MVGIHVSIALTAKQSAGLSVSQARRGVRQLLIPHCNPPNPHSFQSFSQLHKP